MTPFFRRNLSTAGRLIRGVGGVLAVGVAVGFHDDHPKVCLALGVFGVFGILQSIRGWCLLRACGIKLPF